MSQNLYLRQGVVYIPTLGQVEGKGPYRNIDPVDVVPLSEVGQLKKSLKHAIERGNPPVSDILREDHRPVILPKYANLKTWSAFYRTASTWLISDTNGAYKIFGYKKGPRGSWLTDMNQTINLPEGSNLDQVVDRMVEVLQQAVVR